jgi:ABC-type phosphate transport system permease subunit
VIGDGSKVSKSLFDPGTTAASKIAIDFPNTITKLHASSLFYLALILLVIGIVTSLTAQAIARRFDVHRSVT